MENIGPELDGLTHWLTDCPSEFYQLPIDTGSVIQPTKRGASVASIDVAAIVSDHLRDHELPLAVIRKVCAAMARKSLSEQRLIAIVVWLLREHWLMRQKPLADRIASLLTQGLGELARTIDPASAVTDPDRREELTRFCLRELGLRPAGETIEQARDRLNTLDSVERVRIVSQTRDAESRARAIRQAMATKRAQEAAARYSPE